MKKCIDEDKNKIFKMNKKKCPHLEMNDEGLQQNTDMKRVKMPLYVTVVQRSGSRIPWSLKRVAQRTQTDFRVLRHFLTDTGLELFKCFSKKFYSLITGLLEKNQIKHDYKSELDIDWIIITGTAGLKRDSSVPSVLNPTRISFGDYLVVEGIISRPTNGAF